MALDWSFSPPTSIILFHFSPCSNPTPTASTSLGLLHFSSARFFIIEVMLQLTGATHAALIDSGTTSTFVSLELALSSKEIGESIELQLFDSIPTASELVTYHHSDILSLANSLNFPVDLQNANPDIDWKLMTMTFEAEYAQLAASFPLKSRFTLTIEEVIDEDCIEPPNPESTHQSILVDLKREESISTPPNPLSPQAKPIPLHATPSEQLFQPGDDITQP
ncbi:hypothetical protein C0995_014830 [Termitomyces sp. Mi166|nr:hypothetical protein C0995_014830 [Termitomyces sp. Mi166\